MKIMLRVLRKSKKDILKMIELNTFHQNSSIYTHELHNSGEINVQQIRSSDNLVDLFTKALPYYNIQETCTPNWYASGKRSSK